MANQVAYGFMNLSDVFAKKVTEVGVTVVSDAMAQSLAEHNRQLDALMGLFVEKTTDFKTRFRTPTAARLQPLDEQGRALPVNAAGQYDVSFPLQQAGIALGNTFYAREKMTVGDVNEMTMTLQTADMRWMRDHILSALFQNTPWTHTDPEHGALSIVGLANGDSVTYNVMTGADQQATDTHYLAQANAIGAGGDNPFQNIHTEIMEHPENSGEVVVLVPSANIAAVKALTTFNPITDPNIRLGSGSNALVGTLGTAVPGQLIGYEDSKCWVAEWRSLPDNYLIGVCTGGPRPLKMRQEPEPGLQGFIAVGERDDHPYFERQYQRIAGFGGWNRVGAVIQRVGNGAYAIPTGYAAPLA